MQNRNQSNHEPQLQQLNDALNKKVSEMVLKHGLAVEQLTEKQMADCIRQIIVSGDLMRFVRTGEDGKEQQCVTYIPGRSIDVLKARIAELEKIIEDNAAPTEGHP